MANDGMSKKARKAAKEFVRREAAKEFVLRGTNEVARPAVARPDGARRGAAPPADEDVEVSRMRRELNAIHAAVVRRLQGTLTDPRRPLMTIAHARYSLSKLTAHLAEAVYWLDEGWFVE